MPNSQLAALILKFSYTFNAYHFYIAVYFSLLVLTGQLIGKLEFAPNSPNQPPCPQSLITIGNTDIHNLFIFLTCQFGLCSLTPCIDIHTVGNTISNYANELSNNSLVDMDQISLTGSEISMNKTTTMMMNKSRSCITR